MPGTLIDNSALPIDDGAHIGVGNDNTIDLGGGNGGNSGVSPVGGAGGDAGTISITGGTFTIDSGLITLAGGTGGGGFLFGALGTPGDDGLTDVAGGSFTMNGGEVFTGIINHPGTGAFNFNGGTLHVETFNGTLDNNGGTLAPGSSPGITDVSGDYNQNAGTLEIELAGNGGMAGVDFDQLNVTGNLSLAGTLDVSLLGGFVPSIGNAFTIIGFGGASGGMFDNINLPSSAGVGLRLEFVPNIVRLIADLAGDLNGDGFVGIDDLNTVLGNWNAGTPPPPVNSSTNIPEPGTLGVLGISGLALIRRARRGAGTAC